MGAAPPPLKSFLPAGFSSSGIDAGSDIVGYAIDNNGNEHAFLWEPASLLLLGSGLAGLAGLARHRNRK